MSERYISNYQGCFQLVFKNIEQGTLLINIMFNQLNFMSMKTISLLSLDLLQKQELSIMEGGQTASQTVCGCVCVGPVTNGKNLEALNSDVDCADCGASNAHRVSNQYVVRK